MLNRFERQTIEEIAHDKLQGHGITELFVTQLVSETRLFLRRNLNFRKRENQKAVQAYCRMALPEFQGINARQRWANWRTVPKNLSGRLPRHAIRAIDLCCGTGDSTEVLACYLPLGSSILGLEYNSQFVEAARARKFAHRTGAAVEVQFRVQSVLERFRDASGEPVESESVELVNSCGAVGSHFDASATEKLAREIARVLRPGGLAAIDAGAPGTGKRELIRIFCALGFKVVHHAKSHPLDLFTQICFQKL